MRSRLLAPLFAAGILVATSAVAATSPLQEHAHEVRSAIPASIAYYYDHGTWRGMTVTKLRRYDRSIKNVVIRRATKRGFCIRSSKTPFVHFDGRAGKVRQGRCGVRGAVVPFVPRPGTTTLEPTTAESQIRNAVPAIEAYYADHGSYAGMTIAAIRSYDSSIVNVRLVRATRDTYCIESGSGSETRHKNGPGAKTAPGPCPQG